MSNASWFVAGLVVGVLLAMYFVDKEREKLIKQQMAEPQPDFAYGYMEREARRVERPLEERSVAGVVYRDKR